MASLITSIQEALTWIWGLFATLLGTVQDNTILLYVVLVPILVGVIAYVFKLLRKFGVR